MTEKTASAKSGEKTYYQGVGRRKRAIAQVRLFPGGKGDITINDRELANFFPEQLLRNIVTAPLDLLALTKQMTVTVKVSGGGKTGQAEAIRHGIARAAESFRPENRKELKVEGFLMRDSRKKERKKPGLKKARKRPQWKKR